MKKLLCFVCVIMLIPIFCSCLKSEEWIAVSNEKNYASSINSAVSEKEIYVGSVNSDVYYYPECVWANKIKSKNEIWFSSSEDAQDEGYRSCYTCNPKN